jgi:DNA-binding SARP family transcriptional activator
MSAGVRRPEEDTPHGARVGEFAVIAPLRLSLFGGFELRGRGRLIRLPLSAERLVAFLAMQNRSLHRQYVAGSLWPETTDDRASANLRSSLWRLRQRGQPLVEATATHLRLREEVWVDVHEVLALVWRVIDSAPILSEVNLATLSAPAGLLPDWYEDWVLVEQERFHQLRIHALEILCERLTSFRRFGQAVEAGLAAVRGEPLRESSHRALIKAYLAEGNSGEALRQYRRYRQLLHEELGLVPSVEMNSLIGLISAQRDPGRSRASLHAPGMPVTRE